MADFSISEAAFTGFRVVRERPRILAIWSLIQLAFSLVGIALAVGLAGPDLMRLRALTPGVSPDPAQLIAMLGRLGPMYVAILVLALVFSALQSAAINRAVLRPADDRFGYFRLGADEARQFGLVVLAFVVFFGVYLVVILAGGLVAGLLAVALRASAQAIAAVVIAMAAIAMVVLAARLSLASALTFDTHKVDLFGSWALTRGRFWPILGTFFLAVALAGVVAMLCWLVILAATAALGGGSPFAAMMSPDFTSLGVYFTPARIVQTGLGAVVNALIWPLIWAPAPDIYRRLAPAAAADAFA